jgi:hypothetical protein
MIERTSTTKRAGRESGVDCTRAGSLTGDIEIIALLE